ncbi:MAG: cupin domain-containing protein [Actinobacteria bacterium]|nr:cupin domain-containing protein [Actinomycetota bacterium]MCL5985103.1 cupin domain-containing protein [Actinomycetota bacterium]
MTKNKIKIVKRPWGQEHWFAVNNKYIGKVFWVKKGHRLSYAYHEIKDETIYILEGKAELFLAHEDGDSVTEILNRGEAIRIKPGVKHRLKAIEDIIVVEVSTPEVHDHVRLEDDYGRVK